VSGHDRRGGRGEVDLVVVAAKAMDVRDAAAAGSLVGDATVVLPIQNAPAARRWPPRCSGATRGNDG
jgi:hypothetical protein